MGLTFRASFFCIVFLLISSYTVGQISVGAYFGLNNSSFSGDKPRNVSYEFNAGYVLGLTADFKIAKDVYLEVMPSYALGNNAIIEKDSLDEEVIYEYSVRNTGIHLPTIVKIFAKPKLHFDTGLVPSYLLSSSTNIQGEDIDLLDNLNRFYLGVLFGLGYRLELDKSAIGFNLHYVQGINSLSDEPVESSYVPRIRITNVRITAVYHFRIKD